MRVFFRAHVAEVAASLQAHVYTCSCSPLFTALPEEVKKSKKSGFAFSINRGGRAIDLDLPKRTRPQWALYIYLYICSPFTAFLRNVSVLILTTLLC